MKKLCLLVLLAFLLSGCSAQGTEKEQLEMNRPTETFFRESPDDHQDPRWTEQELLTAFYQYAEMGTVVIDCVILEDSVCDIVGVVQYTLPEETGCWFDFIDNQGRPKTGGVEAPPSEKGTLTCAGIDTVSCRLRKAEDTEFTCRITYYESDLETGFRIATE